MYCETEVKQGKHHSPRETEHLGQRLYGNLRYCSGNKSCAHEYTVVPYTTVQSLCKRFSFPSKRFPWFPSGSHRLCDNNYILIVDGAGTF